MPNPGRQRLALPGGHPTPAGRVEGDTTFASATELASALKRAEAAHGEYEKGLGHRDADWPIWYAEYMVREQAGKEQPK